MPYPKKADAIISRIAIEDEQRLAIKRTNAAIVRDLKGQRGEAQTRLAQALASPRTIVGEGGEHLKTNAGSFITEEQAIIARHNQQIAKLTENDNTPRMTAAKLRSGLDPHTRYVSLSVEPKLRKGETPTKALPRFRSEIEAKRGERKAISRKARTVEETRAKWMDFVRQSAARGMPRVIPTFHGADPEWPSVAVSGTGGATVSDGVAIICAFFQDEIESKIDALLEFNAPEGALTASGQRTALARIDEELMSLYRMEAALVESIVADGGNAYHLPDRPAVAVLGIRPA